MCIALIGGMDQLGRCYLMEAERVGISLKVFNGPEARLTSRMGKVDGMVIFTNKVSHRARREAMATAILDRLLHRCHVLAIKGRSYRLKELEKLLK